MVYMVDRMCVVCMDYMMRTILIAISGIVICAAIYAAVFIHQGDIGPSGAVQTVSSKAP